MPPSNDELQDLYEETIDRQLFRLQRMLKAMGFSEMSDDELRSANHKARLSAARAIRAVQSGQSQGLSPGGRSRVAGQRPELNPQDFQNPMGQLNRPPQAGPFGGQMNLKLNPADMYRGTPRIPGQPMGFMQET